MEIQIHLQRVAQDIGISDLTSFDLAEALDDADPLKFLRNEFAYPKMRTLPHGESFHWNISNSAILNEMKSSTAISLYILDFQKFINWISKMIVMYFVEPFFGKIEQIDSRN